MNRLASRTVAAVAALAVLVVLVACSSGAQPEPSASNSPSSGPVATGVVGAAHLDDGYLVVGDGAVTIDLYFDAMCPICGAFEEKHGERLAALVSSGAIALRLHPMTFLDRASQGTEYSTRAAAALTCVAAGQPAKTLDFFAALYVQQPEEGSSGLSDDMLTELAAGVDAEVGDCIADGRYRSWAQQVNERALDGPIPGAEIASIKGTPTLLRDGVVYSGNPLDGQALARFLTPNENSAEN